MVSKYVVVYASQTLEVNQIHWPWQVVILVDWPLVNELHDLVCKYHTLQYTVSFQNKPF